MKYAIIQTSGKQYKVEEGDTILIDRVNQASDSQIVFSQVLLVRTDENIYIGQPYVDKGKVVGKVVSQVKGEKITTAKFKAKVRYRKKIGFRSSLTKVLIEKISFEAKDKTKKDKREKLLDPFDKLRINPEPLGFVRESIDLREKKQ